MKHYNPKEDRPLSKPSDSEISQYVKEKFNTSQVTYDDLERLARDTDVFYEKIKSDEKII